MSTALNNNNTNCEAENTNSNFANQANQQSHNLVREFTEFLSENKKWWLMPIIIALLIFSALFILSPTIAPFIYRLF